MATFLERLPKNNACRTFIIAEAGVHHGGSLETARELIDAAAQAGADAIKFQTYKAASLVTVWAPKYWQLRGDGESESQYAYFGRRDRFEFEDYQALSEYARQRGILFCSTPFDLQAVDWLSRLAMPFWKIASGDVDNFPLLAAVAATGQPVVLSTGASYFKEIESAVAFLRSRGVTDLALLHCTLAYPTPDDQANLGRIRALRRLFAGLPVGYSDHTIPAENAIVPVIAVAMGAVIVEKHFTLDRSQAEDDHYHSVDPVSLASMVAQIKTAEDAVRQAAEMMAVEQPARENARRSLVASRDLPAGTVLTNGMIVPKRPGGGISPAETETLLGRQIARALKEDEQITRDHLVEPGIGP